MSEKYSKYSDKELYNSLSLSRSEAEASFSELYARYSQRVYAYCLRMTGNNEDASDIFQETFSNLYESAQKDKERTNIGGYLITIARNLCYNHSRSKKINIELDDFYLKTNDTGYEEKELLNLISSALEILDFEYKEAFILRQYHGLSYQEISEITEDSVSAIKNRFWRAKEKIKEILAPYLNEISNNK